MAPSGRHPRRGVVVVVAVMASIAALAGAGPAASAQEAERSRPESRLRAADAKAAFLLRAGIARSATFRTLADTIEHSDLVVYVETRPMMALPGQDRR